MRLCHYLCGMKTIKFISLTAFLFCLNMPLHAQFNTIGPINKKRIYTTNSPKPKEALTNSIVVADSVPVSTTIDNDGNGQTTVSPFDNQDLMSLVALPLKKIHINSGFGMRNHPVYHRKMMHNGIDLSARYEKVYSMFPGTVIKVGQDSMSGKFITVRTGDYTISYCHLSQQLVKEKEFVNAGTNIAISGKHWCFHRATSASDNKKRWPGIQCGHPFGVYQKSCLQLNVYSWSAIPRLII